MAGTSLLAACGRSGGSGESDRGGLAVEQRTGRAATAAAGTTSARSGAAAAGGRIVADSGFRADRNGLPFPNYANGPGITNLTPEDLRQLWGDAVCSNTLGGHCELTPPAVMVMDELNGVMDGGHCFGLSVASLMFAKGQLQASAFGRPEVPQLVFAGNRALQRRIAVGFIGQVLDSVRAKTLTGPPNAFLDFLQAHLADRTTAESYTLGIHQPDGSGGHAVTPYAVVDRGGDIFGLQVYDNNFPGQAREITFDRRRNSWSYYGSPEPDEPEALYAGDAATETMELFPTTPAFGVQPCPFCAGGGDGLAVPLLGRVFVTGTAGNHPRLVLEDDQGRRTGYVDGKLLQEIPGVRVEHRYYAIDGRPSGEPAYRVPLDVPLTVTIDGDDLSKPAEATVGFVGEGYALTVDGLELKPGQSDELTLPAGGTEFSYTAGGKQSPTFEVGADFAGADFAFRVDARDVSKGASFSLDLTSDRLGIDTSGKAGDFDVAVRRLDGKGEELFDHDGLALRSDSVGGLLYREFTESGQAMTFEVERNGSVEEQQLSDEDEDDAAEPSTTTSTTTTSGPKAGGADEQNPDSTSTPESSSSTTGSTGDTRQPADGGAGGDPGDPGGATSTTQVPAGDDRPSTTSTAPGSASDPPEPSTSSTTVSTPPSSPSSTAPPEGQDPTTTSSSPTTATTAAAGPPPGAND